jgi:hypothetical protein
LRVNSTKLIYTKNCLNNQMELTHNLQYQPGNNDFHIPMNIDMIKYTINNRGFHQQQYR